MGFLPVSQRLHISVSALPEREIKTGVVSVLLVAYSLPVYIKRVSDPVNGPFKHHGECAGEHNNILESLDICVNIFKKKKKTTCILMLPMIKCKNVDFLKQGTGTNVFTLTFAKTCSIMPL